MRCLRSGIGRRGSLRGFTLTEVMTAVLILTFVFSVFGASFPACGQAVSRARHLDAATDAGQQRIDTLRAAAFASLPQPAQNQSTVTQTFSPPGTLPGAVGTLKFTAVNSSLATSTGPSSRLRVDATVTWSGHGADHGAVTLTALLVK